MILDCPNCAAKFLVADTQIPANGRDVRCGRCAHVWFVAPPPSVDTEAVENELKDLLNIQREEPSAPEVDAAGKSEESAQQIKRNVPAVARKTFTLRPFKIAVFLLFPLWIVLAGVANFPAWVDAPLVGPIYRMLAITPTDGLAFSELHMEREALPTKTRFIITGSIVNHAAQPRLVPLVHVALKNKDGKVIWGRNYPAYTELKPGEVYPFRIPNVETAFADQVDTLVLDLGHSLSLMLR